MENSNKPDSKSPGFMPMILGATSALAIVVIVSFLVAVKRKICCTQNNRLDLNDKAKKNNTNKIKKRRIGYDIPIESKPVVSSVIWQQEENDIAEEVKKIYNNISNCSKPVLFDTNCGMQPQIDCSNNVLDTTSVKVPIEGEEASKGKIKKEQVRNMDLQLDIVNKVAHKNYRDSSYHRQAGAFLSKNQSIGANAQAVFMEDVRRSQVQEWVDNSIGTLNMENEANTIGNTGQVLGRDSDKVWSELHPQEVIKGGNRQQHCTEKLEKKQRACVKDAPKEEDGTHFDMGGNIGKELGECYEKTNDLKELKSCLKKGTGWKERTMEKSFEEPNKVPEINFDKEKLNQKRLAFTDNDNFVTTRDVKKYIVTRWIDHSVTQNKSRVTEEESDTTLAEKSANELEYEDIDSVLTSVSRMDEERLSELKASEFYKGLLKRKINRYKALGEKIDEVSLVDRKEASKCEVNSEDGGRKNTERNSDRMVVEEKKQYSVSEKRDKIWFHETERESLAESSILHQISNKEGFDEKTKPNRNENDYGGSVISDHENNVTLKYSIVRNFSDRLKPTIYVSLQHIHGLGKAFGYENTATARLYFAIDGEEYEESDPMKCFDDIYQEQMFSVVGTSTKAIINDALVIEIILDDNDEPELHVKLPLEGLKHKATLINSVIFDHGPFIEAI